MDVYEVVGATGAEADEGLEVGQACLTSGVGHGRGAELDGAVVGLHEGLVDSHALGWCEVGF